MNETWWVRPEQLDDDQRAIIELPATGDFLISGPPGSGKTNLLLLRANYLTLAGMPNLALLVFTRTLQEFLHQGGNRYAFALEKVQTSQRFFRNVLRAFGVAPEVHEEFGEQRTALVRQVGELLDKRQLRPILETLLLDEAQDYLPEELLLFRRLARQLFIVADARQKIYSTPDVSEILRQIAGEPLRLRYHYRNGLMICRFADKIASAFPDYEPLEDTCNYNEELRPSSVEHVACANLTEQATRIVERLRIQLEAYPDELIGVITRRREDLESLWVVISASDVGHLAVLQSRTDGYVPFEAATRICVTTIHSAKGLEFRALHLAAADQLAFRPHERNVGYTAVTRAKTSLVLYSSGALPGFLDEALNAVNPRPPLPNLSDVFGGIR